MHEDFDISSYTLFEKQSKFFNGYSCPYCLGDTDLVDSKEVYQESHGLIYICRQCKAWCGTHNGSDQSLGCVAKKTLRDIRHECHKWFEPLVVAKQNKDGASKRKAKAAAYNWLAKELGIDVIECHFGYFNIAQCKQALEIIKNAYPTPQKLAQREREIQFNKDAWYFNSTDFDLEIKEFSLMNICHLEVTHPKSGKSLKYWPKDNTAAWTTGKKKKPFNVGDIDSFIQLHFK